MRWRSVAELERRLARLSEEELEQARAALGLTGAASVEELERLLAREDAAEDVLSAAGYLLGRLGDRRLLPERLAPVLWRGHREEHRWAAAMALALLGGLRARRELRRALQLHAEPGTRALAAWALGFAGGGADALLLLDRLDDAGEAAPVRANVAEALGHLFLGAEPPGAVVAALERAAAAADGEVAAAAAEALRGLA